MGIVLHVVQHGVDALAVLLQALLIDIGREQNVLWVFATLHITDGGNLTAWDILDDMLVGQRLQHFVEVGRAQATLLADECFVNVAKVGKESTVVAQEGDDEAVLIVGEVVETIEFVTFQEETHACLQVGSSIVFYIAGTLQNLQGGMDAHREMVETLTEDVDVELTGDAETIACGYLEEVGQVFIDLTNLVLGREGVVDAFGEFGIITIIIEQDSLSRLAVTTCTTCFLEVGLDGVGTVVVHDQTDVGLVDAHTEGVGADDDAYLVLLPVALALVFHLVVQSGMIEGGA